MIHPAITRELAALHRRELIEQAERYRAPKIIKRARTAIDHAALRDTLPVAAALAPFAMVIGLAIGSRPGNPAGGLSGALLLYSGSAHLAALTLLAKGASVVSILAAITLINARFLVYGAALTRHFVGQPAWFRWSAPHFIVDAALGLVTARDDLGEPARFRRYWLTMSGVIALSWTSFMAVGALLRPVGADVAAVSFLPVVALLAILMRALHGRPAVASAAVAFAVAFSAPVPGVTRALCGLIAGAAVGVLIERKSR